MDRRVNKNKGFVLSIGIFLIIGTILLVKTLSSDKNKTNLLNLKDSQQLLSVKVDGTEVKDVPERGLYKTNVVCNNGYGEWDYNSWSLKLTDLKGSTKCNIEFTKTLTEEEYNAYLEIGKALRRNTYRGKDITGYYNDGSLYEMINEGTFDDIYVGDYIIANGVTWLIADIDNYLNSGDTPLTKHHATIIPANSLMTAPMNATNTTEGGYANSKMVKETLASLVTNEGIIGKTFGNHILEYRNCLSTKINPSAINQSGSIDAGASNGWAWYTRKIDLMSEANVYGTTVWSSSGYDMGIDSRQYAIFQLNPELINSYENIKFMYWLKDISSSGRFTTVNSSGISGYSLASTMNSVRPRFLIG